MKSFEYPTVTDELLVIDEELRYLAGDVDRHTWDARTWKRTPHEFRPRPVQP